MARRALTPDSLRARRLALSLTQADLAEALGRHVNTIARQERGEIPIGSPRMVEAVLTALERPTPPTGRKKQV